MVSQFITTSTLKKTTKKSGVTVASAMALVAFALVTGSTPANAAAQYATHIVASTGVNNGNAGAGNATSVLGAPNGDVEDFDNAGGQKGYVTVGFASGVKIIDGEGDDVLVHLKDFSTVGTDGTTPEDETFSVLGSADGNTFVTLTPTSKSPQGSAINQPVTLGFNIAGQASYIKFVKIQNLRHVENNPFEGPDIDAVEARNFTVESATTPTPAATPANQCADGVDNEGDGFEDKADPDCYDTDGNYDPTNEEDTDNSHNQCVDKKDNDSDKLIDFSDPDCHTDGDATDGDDTFDPTRKENHKQGQVAAVTVVPVAVPVTARTGMSLPLMSIVTLIGAGATALATKRYRG